MSLSHGQSGNHRKQKRNYEPILIEAFDEIDIPQPQQSSNQWKVVGSFWILGLLNNASYVIMLACAKSISEGGTGLVFLANIIPSLGIKASAPYWFHTVSYSTRLDAATILMAASFFLVAVSSSNRQSTSSASYKLYVQLLGVAFGSAQAGLGEASLLALAGKTDAAVATTVPNGSSSSSKGQCLTSFSSGTGMAGVFGFFWKWWWSDFFGFSLSVTLLLALGLALGYWTTFRYAMTHQPRGSVYGDEGEEKQIQTTTASDSEDSERIMPPRETLALNAGGSENDGIGDTMIDSDDDGLLEIGAMTGRQKFRLVLSLWPYMVPLFVVYAAEYALQAGTWSAMGFPYTDMEARDRFYEFSNWMYQAGVFLSRSSGTLFTVPIWVLWLMPALQTLNLVVFCWVASHAAESPWLYQPALLYTGAFYTGLLGGAVYISGYKRICADVPLIHREFALSATSVAEGLGIVVADAVGLLIQGCLYQINGLEGAILSCPFQ